MNFNQTFSVLFWLNKSKVNKKGLIPIWVRITIDGKRAECSIKRQILTEYWNPEKGQATREWVDASTLNEYLLIVRSDILRHYNILLSSSSYVTAEDVKRSYQGIKQQNPTLLKIFNLYIQHLRERKEIGDISHGRLSRFIINYRKCASFLKHRFKKTDVLLEKVHLGFIVEFEHYLRTTEMIGHNTAMKYSKDLKQVFKYAVQLQYIPSNPFDPFRCSYKKVTREFLDQEELNIFSTKKFNIARLSEVRDCYLFSCYTGYAYSDAEALSPDDVSKGIDGNKWIIRNRKKTGTVENVPLLPVAIEVIERYKNHPYCVSRNKLLPMNSNQRYNAYLKEIADQCGIQKKLTTHTARHTFATTVLLLNDVPMETTMELLGHNDIRTTQIYGKIVQKKLSNDMQKLKSRLSVPERKIDEAKM